MNTETDLKLSTIVAPQLSDVEFGANVRKLFENINRNFEILANRDFVKGDKGKDVRIEPIVLGKIYEDPNIENLKSLLINRIKIAIKQSYNELELAPIYYIDSLEDLKAKVLNWDDNIVTQNSIIYLIYSDDKIISSLAYVVLDKRFNDGFGKIYVKKQFDTTHNINYTLIDEADAYENKVDTSSVVYIELNEDESDWKVSLANNWPSLYYDTDISDFCWKYQGVYTKMPARGPKGLDAVNIQNMFLVLVDSKNTSVDRIILKVMAPTGNWVPIDDYIMNYKTNGWPEISKGSTAVVFETNSVAGNTKYWISIISITKNILGYPDTYKVICALSTSINNLFNENSFIDIMKRISPTNNIKGFFVPFNPISKSTIESGNPLPAHCIFSSKGLGSMNYNDLNIASIKNFYDIGNQLPISDMLLSESQIHVWNDTNFKSDVNVKNITAKTADINSATFEHISLVALGTSNKTLKDICELAIGTVTPPLKLIKSDNILDLNNELSLDISQLNFAGQKVEPGEIFNNYNSNTAQGNYSHAEGNNTHAYGNYSHAEGISSPITYINCNILILSSKEFKIIDYPSNVVLDRNDVIRFNLFQNLYKINDIYKEGSSLRISVDKSITDISNNIYNITKMFTAYGEASHVEGYGTAAIGTVSHAEGYRTAAIGTVSHAEGFQTNSDGDYSHAEGQETIAIGTAAHAEGKFNYGLGFLSTIGIGKNNEYRLNALAVTSDGKIYVKDLGDYRGTSINDDTTDLVTTFNNLKFSIKSQITKEEIVDIVENVEINENTLSQPASKVFDKSEGIFLARTGTVSDKYMYYKTHDTMELGTPTSGQIYICKNKTYIGYATPKNSGEKNKLIEIKDLNVASLLELGGIKLGFKPEIGLENSFPVQLSDDNKAFVDISEMSLIKKPRFEEIEISQYKPGGIKPNQNIVITPSNINIYSLFGNEENTTKLLAGEIKINNDSVVTKNNIPVATTELFGGIKLGYKQNGTKIPLQEQNGLVFVDLLNAIPVSTTTSVGGIKSSNNGKIGNNYYVSVNSDGLAYINIPDQIATETQLGKVKPVVKTTKMTLDVGVDKTGKLFTELAETIKVVDNLNSSSTTSALAASCGQVLNTKIDSLNSNINSVITDVSSLSGDINSIAADVSSLSNDVNDITLGRLNSLTVNQLTASQSITTTDITYSGKLTGPSADYAEMFEWFDNNLSNEDRIGYLVTLNGDKIIKANDNDILGIISSNPNIIGNNPEEWPNKYLIDDWGRKTEVLNPDYDETKTYIKRSDRSEWSPVGLLGLLRVRLDGTLKVNDYCSAKNGIATYDKNGNIRVLKIINDNIALVLLK